MAAAADITEPALTTQDLCDRLDVVVGHAQVALGVSGGSDSVALMHAIASWARSRCMISDNGRPPVTVLTVDHRLRAASGEEAARVEQWAHALGFEHVTLVWEGPKPESGVPARARDARYALMTQWCIGRDVGCLLVGHTLDDQAETVLMRLGRGSGVDGLSAMAPVTMLNGVAVMRPLLDVSRAQLRRFLDELGQPWIDDPTNADTAYERVRVRAALETLEPLGLTPRRLALTARRLQRARAALDAIASGAMEANVEAYVSGYCRIDPAVMADYPEEVALRVFSRCLTAVGGGYYPPRQVALEKLCERLRKGDMKTRTLGGCQIMNDGGWIMIAREAGRVADDPVNLCPGERVVWDGRFTVGYDLDGLSAKPCAGLTVQPLRAPGWVEMKHCGYSCPKALRESLVSFWQGDTLVAVPHFSFRSDTLDKNIRLTADFCNFPLLDGARKIANSGQV